MSNQNIGTVTQTHRACAGHQIPRRASAGPAECHHGGERGRAPSRWRWRSTSATTLCAASPCPAPTALCAARKPWIRAAPSRCPWAIECLGRIFNLLGDPVDNLPAPEAQERWPIHRQPPAYDEQESTTEILGNRHQGRGPHRPLRQGRQDRPVRRRGRGQRPVLIMELINNVAKEHGGLFGIHRRGRAHPRGQRPVQRDEGERRAFQNGAGVRPDERAAGSAYARGPFRA